MMTKWQWGYVVGAFLWGYVGSREIHLCSGCRREGDFIRLAKSLVFWPFHMAVRVFYFEPKMRQKALEEIQRNLRDKDDR